jgi:hypothetical protein
LSIGESAYVKGAAYILFMLDIHGDIQIIEDVALICSRTDAQLQKKITLNWLVVSQN